MLPDILRFLITLNQKVLPVACRFQRTINLFQRDPLPVVIRISGIRQKNPVMLFIISKDRHIMPRCILPVNRRVATGDENNRTFGIADILSKLSVCLLLMLDMTLKSQPGKMRGILRLRWT